MSAGETVYVDIAAVRIQRYLSRTPSLRGRRAASAALAEATSWERIEKSVAGRAERNTEAGKADGVVNLQLTAHDPARREALVDEVSTAVLRRLRRELPGAEFQAVWGSATDTCGPVWRRSSRGSSEGRCAPTCHPERSSHWPRRAGCAVRTRR